MDYYSDDSLREQLETWQAMSCEDFPTASISSVRELTASIEVGGRLVKIRFAEDQMVPILAIVKDDKAPAMQ